MVIELLEQIARLKRTWILAPVYKFFKRFLKIIALAFIYQLAKFDDLMSSCSKNAQRVID